MKKFEGKLEFKKTIISDMEQREIQGGWISRGCSSVICLAICITKHIDVPTIGHDDGPNCYGHTDTDVGI